MSFDHHDPEIEALMWSRAHAQGDQLIATNPVVARHHERMDDPAHQLAMVLRATDITVDQLLQVINDTMDAFNRVMANFAEAMTTIGTDRAEFAKKLADLTPDRADGSAPIERLRHGHAAVCPKHGPTSGGLCRRCTR